MIFTLLFAVYLCQTRNLIWLRCPCFVLVVRKGGGLARGRWTKVRFKSIRKLLTFCRNYLWLFRHFPLHFRQFQCFQWTKWNLEKKNNSCGLYYNSQQQQKEGIKYRWKSAVIFFGSLSGQFKTNCLSLFRYEVVKKNQKFVGFYNMNTKINFEKVFMTWFIEFSSGI